MIHVRDRSPCVSLEFLRGLPPPLAPAGAGRYWRGVPHIELLDALSLRCDRHGIALASPLLYRHPRPDGTDLLVASWDVAVPRIAPPAGAGFVLGLSNDNTGDRPLSLYAGVRLLGEGGPGVPILCYGLGKHTVKSLWRKRLPAALSAFRGNAAFLLPERIQSLKRCKISERRERNLLWVACKKGWVNWSTVGLIDAAFRKKGGTNSGSLWRLYLAVAKENEKMSPLKQMARDYAFLSWAQHEGVKQT